MFIRILLILEMCHIEMCTNHSEIDKMFSMIVKKQIDIVEKNIYFVEILIDC